MRKSRNRLMRHAVCLSAVLLLALTSAQAVAAPGNAQSRVAVVVGLGAPELERYAAEQLCDYLNKLFAIQIRPSTSIPATSDGLFLLGSSRTNPAVKRATARQSFPQVSEQGIVLRRTQLRKRPALIVGGGSPRATLWAVYELVERWGVRYLLHGDVLPKKVREFHLPEIDVTMEPKLPIRQWRVINDFACGPESWGMADYRPVLDQLAKLKFNRILVVTYPWQPFLDLRVRGIQRHSAWLWYDAHFPITSDMVGRDLFGNEGEFWNPDLPRNTGYKELAGAAKRLAHNLMDYAHRRGMECVMTADLSHFPAEFAPMLKSTLRGHGFQRLTIVPGPGTEVEEPGLIELATAVLRTTVDTYPEADFVTIEMPEYRQWVAKYERAWWSLDAKYGLEKILPLNQVLAAARRRTDYPGGTGRAVREVKGDIVSLYFYDRLLNELKALQGSRRPDVKFILNAVAEELFPILPRVVPHGWELLNFVDYTPSRILRRRDVLKNIPGREVPASLIYTLHDDNVGLLPQLTTGSLYQLTQDLLRHGWAGFSTRYWLIGDHDPSVASLARAAWDADATPERVVSDQLRAVCGEGCVDEMLATFHEVESVTTNLEWNNLHFSFPVPGMMMKHWKPEPMPADLIEDRSGYRRALEAARRALAKATPAGRSYVQYWIGRLEFGVGYINAVEAVRRAATAEAEKKTAEALQFAQEALAQARGALEAYARVARDQSDRGAIATMNEYVYRALRAKIADVKN